MNICDFLKTVFHGVSVLDEQVKTKFKFSQNELNEIIQTSKKENLKFLGEIYKITQLTSFDVSFLLSSVSLSPEKIDLLKRAVEIYDEHDFKAQGQTMSDFIFRVAANIDLLSEVNLDVFKELVQCKNEVYDFTNIMKNPTKHLGAKKKADFKFAFQRVIVDK